MGSRPKRDLWAVWSPGLEAKISRDAWAIGRECAEAHEADLGATARDLESFLSALERAKATEGEDPAAVRETHGAGDSSPGPRMGPTQAYASMAALVPYFRRGAPPLHVAEMARVWSSGRMTVGASRPAIEVSGDALAGSLQLALSSSATYYWFAFVLSSDGRLVVPIFFRDKLGRCRSQSIGPVAGRPPSMEIGPLSSGTAYAFASTGDCLPDPGVDDAQLHDALLRGVRVLRAQRRPLFFMEHPFGPP